MRWFTAVTGAVGWRREGIRCRPAPSLFCFGHVSPHYLSTSTVIVCARTGDCVPAKSEKVHAASGPVQYLDVGVPECTRNLRAVFVSAYFTQAACNSTYNGGLYGGLTQSLRTSAQTCWAVISGCEFEQRAVPPPTEAAMEPAKAQSRKRKALDPRGALERAQPVRVPVCV